MHDLNYRRMGQGGRSDRFSCYPGRAYSSSELQIIAGKDWTRAEMPSSSILADLSSEASTSGNAAYLEHTVTRLDTLAGVAIKYGVEVCFVWLDNVLFVFFSEGLFTMHLYYRGMYLCCENQQPGLAVYRVLAHRC